ncbi:paraslipin [filamentous cyanobacterium CCP5]|nr:paraslipin [filamentous cyanobacterium CCP5]
MGSSIFGILAFLIVGYSVTSVRMITQGNEALVERLGRYDRKLKPGLNFIVPLMDRVVLKETLREQILDIEPQTAITRDNVALEADAVVYWRILDLERTYYEIEDVEKAIEELVTTTLRSEIGKMNLEDTFSSRDAINKALIEQLDEATDPWGVKIMRVELQEIKPPPEVIRSMQQQQAAEIQKKAAVTAAEGEKEAAVARAKGTVESIEQLASAFQKHGDSKAILQYLIASQYVEANQKLGESNNSKVLFMDPKMLTEGLVDLINSGDESGLHMNKGDDDDLPPPRERRSQRSGR